MNLPVVAALLLALVCLVLGWPLARRVARSPSWVLATTPAAAGLACAASVSVSILTRTSMVPWLLVIGIAGWAAEVQRRRQPRHAAVSDAPGGGVLLVAAIAAVAPVVLVDLPLVEADPRLIWWFHAAWFREGGDVTRQAMVQFDYPQTGYPPVVPGLIAAVWHVAGAYDRELALRVTQLFTAAGVATTGFLVSATLRLGRRGAMVAAALVAAVCWGSNATVGLNGLVDLTWAVFFAPAAVLLLAGPTDWRTTRVAALLLATAVLIKFEAQGAGMILLALTVARSGRAWRRACPVALALAGSIGTWLLVTTVADAPVSGETDWSKVGEVFRPGSQVHARFMEAIPLLRSELGPLVGLSALAILLIVVLGRLAGTPLRQPGLLLLLALAAGHTLVIALSIAVGEFPMFLYVDFGVYRTVIVIRLLVLLDVALAGVAAGRALGALAPSPPDGEDAEPGGDHASGIRRRRNSSKSGTVNAVSP